MHGSLRWMVALVVLVIGCSKSSTGPSGQSTPSLSGNWAFSDSSNWSGQDNLGRGSVTGWEVNRGAVSISSTGSNSYALAGPAVTELEFDSIAGSPASRWTQTGSWTLTVVVQGGSIIGVSDIPIPTSAWNVAAGTVLYTTSSGSNCATILTTLSPGTCTHYIVWQRS